jgi:hypothetical protein
MTTLATDLADAVQAIWAALSADVDVVAAAPGGVHVNRGPEVETYPMLLVEWVDGRSTNHFGGVVAIDTTTVRVRALDKSTTTTGVLALSNAAHRRLIANRALPMNSAWRVLQVNFIGGFELVHDEADERHQERGATYHVLSCPI